MSTIVEYYARRALEYERIYAKPERQVELAALRVFVAETLAGRNVLEIACGTGYWTEVLARTAGSITAVDFNEEVLAIARAKPIDQDRVTFQQADVYSLPQFPQPFTACLAGFWWSHVPKSRLGEFLTQLHGALTPGATVLFFDNVYSQGSSTPIAFDDAEGNTYQRRPLDDGTTHDVLKNFPTAHELRQTLDGLGTAMQIEFRQFFWSMTYVPQMGV